MPNHQPLVSVCIPAYNHERYVQDTIQSVIDQTYPNIELIIIDDGSTDNTWKKICELQSICEKRFVRVVFQTKANEGTCATCNKLYSLANGKYIYHIASDDMSKPNAISEQVDFLEKNPNYGLVVGDNEIIDSDSEHCYWDTDRNNVYKKKDAVYLSFADFLKRARKDLDFNSDGFGSYVSLVGGNYIPNGYLIRKSILEKTGLYTKDAPLEDWYMMLQISKYAKIKYLDKVLFSYRWHCANTIKQTTKMQRYEYLTRFYEYKIVKKDKQLVNKLYNKYGTIRYFEKSILKLGHFMRIYIQYAIPKNKLKIKFGK